MTTPQLSPLPSERPSKNARTPLPSGASLHPNGPINSASSSTTPRRPVSGFWKSVKHAPKAPIPIATTTSRSEIDCLIDTVSGTPLEPILRSLSDFIIQNRVQYDDLLRRQKNAMKKYVVEEREVMEKMCTDWTDEVENDIRLFIATEITSDRDQSTIPNSDSSYRKVETAHALSPSPVFSIKVEPTDTIDYHQDSLPEYRPVTRDERIQVRVANLLRNFQQRSLRLKKSVSHKFSHFAAFDRKEHERITYEQEQKLRSLIEGLINHQNSQSNNDFAAQSPMTLPVRDKRNIRGSVDLTGDEVDATMDDGNTKPAERAIRGNKSKKRKVSDRP
ncbi:hypothetical protein GLAREA_03766 [Glarea lozoyensis ATCC 20868]|uniref:Uncharacterized protein n=1 Tax=Glarea lozoyensis (strain ATCC 20868 / MF5171) TaxID=1116229 RepID=S3D0Y8_GLAL2|nr:uncharacterized protein GLAREA_03766 [Glarea lozoyensis ATCC 20868]EPE30799.1 hypothetical protein GLAREA_03766 [Glarea lozoyensis ATCC 20868]